MKTGSMSSKTYLGHHCPQGMKVTMIQLKCWLVPNTCDFNQKPLWPEVMHFPLPSPTLHTLPDALPGGSQLLTGYKSDPCVWFRTAGEQELCPDYCLDFKWNDWINNVLLSTHKLPGALLGVEIQKSCWNESGVRYSSHTAQVKTHWVLHNFNFLIMH